MSDYYLPDEVLIEILKRLPVKSLLRFRSVTKPWCSLISNPTFITTHIDHNLTNTHFIFAHRCRTHDGDWYSLHPDNDTFYKHTELEPPFEGFNDSFRVIGCCNGLICASKDLGSRTITLLWNPSIRKFLFLPTPNIGSTSLGMFVLGFGFDHVKDTYKVVRIAYTGGFGGPLEVELYELSTGTWRGIDVVVPPYIISMYSCPPVDVNGALHWVACNPNRPCGFHNLILAFDIVNEMFREIMLPGNVTDENPLNLKMSGERSGTLLSLFQYFVSTHGRRCCIWVMKEYGVMESWSKVCFIDLQQGLQIGLGFRKTGEVLLATWDGELVSYDPENGETRNLGIHGNKFTSNDLRACSLHVDSYTESLVLLEQANGLLEM